MAPRPLLTALLLATLGSVTAVQYTDCGSKDGHPISVDVKGCGDTGTCVLKKGTDAVLTINFTSNVTSQSLTAKAYGVVEHVPIPFPLPKTDACTCGVKCPIQPQGQYVYQASFLVKEAYPSISLNVKWELIDDAKQYAICVLIPVEIS